MFLFLFLHIARSFFKEHDPAFSGGDCILRVGKGRNWASVLVPRGGEERMRRSTWIFPSGFFQNDVGFAIRDYCDADSIRR